METVVFMYMDKEKAINNCLLLTYNFIWLFRWFLTQLLVPIFVTENTGMAGAFVLMDLVMMVWTCYGLKAFRKPAGYLILFSEMCLLYRHFGIYMLFENQFSANSPMDQGGVNFISGSVFFAYLFGTIAEFILLFEPLFPKKNLDIKNEEELNLQVNENGNSNQLQIADNRGITKKMTVYNKKKKILSQDHNTQDQESITNPINQNNQDNSPVNSNANQTNSPEQAPNQPQTQFRHVTYDPFNANMEPSVDADEDEPDRIVNMYTRVSRGRTRPQPA
jgi:hypothetical protein